MLDRWQLKDFDPGQGSPDDAASDDAGWIEVSAPGDTYLALIEAGRIPHPFKDRNEAAASWVRDREWWQRTQFDAPPPTAGERVSLVFEGLDTFADIYLDGEPLGQTANMFRTYAFDITDRLHASESHTLAIRFSPTFTAVAGRPVPNWSHFTDRVSASRRNLMRKAQFGWGWDWGPDLPTVGVYKPVRLERRAGAKITGVNVVTILAGAGQVSVLVNVEAAHLPTGRDLRIEAALIDPDGVPAASANGAAVAASSLQLAVPSPRLWWTADLGEQPLYGLTVRLYDGETLLDEQTRRVGLRTVTIDTSPDPDEPGTNFFRFVLNGAPIFAKGACWIPASSFVGAITGGHYRDLLSRAVDANMNMLRIWGGGIYEPDIFYDLCDELGLLVWQDFMFACAHYPEDDAAYIEEVRQEIADQVRRLRGHACLAVWCGNNENQAMQDIENQLTGGNHPLAGQIFYDQIMPEMLADLDPTTAYWPSSPYGGPVPNSMRAGDVHNWTVWHGLPLIADATLDGAYDNTPAGVHYTRYAEDNCRFVSEFGIQAAPQMATLKRWMAPEDLVLGSEGMFGRIKDVPTKANAMMEPVTGLPSTLEEYALFSQWTQAEGLKFGIEHYRRRKPHCSGALIWQYNDCWPCVSWSLVDYDGVGKASLYAVTRVFAPVLASFKALADGEIELWITNDTLRPLHGQAIVALARLAGGEDWRQTVDYNVPANASVPVWCGKAGDGVLIVRSPNAAFPPNRRLPAEIGELALTAGAKPEVTIEQAAPNELKVHLTASQYLTFVNLASDRPDLRFSDNFFDLAAGETATVTVQAESAISPADVAVGCWNARL